MLRLLSFADIHFARFSNGLTLDDVTDVANQFIAKAQELNPDVLLFLGDLYVSREPPTEVRFKAEQFVVNLTKLGKPIVWLIGNHCRTTKSPNSIHAMTYTKLYNLPNLHIVDVAKVEPIYIGNEHVNFYCVPADHHVPDWTLDTNEYNICLFHGMIAGSFLPTGIPMESGFSAALFDKEYDIVIGGDNHHRQVVDGFKNTKCVYVGASLQHNFGDVGDDRGFLHIELDQHAKLEWINTIYPKFMKESISIAGMAELMAWATSTNLSNNIVKLTINGTADLLQNLDIDMWEQKLKELSGARLIKLNLHYKLDSADTVRPKINDIDEWSTFIQSRLHTLAPDIDSKLLNTLGRQYIVDIN